MVVCFIPAKAESRRLPQKNQQLLSGYPLWLKQALKCQDIDAIDEVVVDTDSDAIAEHAGAFGLSAIVREHNDADGHELFSSEIAHRPSATTYVQCLATAPFLKAKTITSCIELVTGESNWENQYESVAACHTSIHYPFPQSESIDDSDTIEAELIESMGLYVVNGDLARERGKRCYPNTYPHILNDFESFDLDYPYQLEMARLIAEGEASRDKRRLDALGNILSTALLSDCGARYLHGINGTEQSFIGRATTLELTDDRGEGTSIYDALGQYDYCQPGSVVVVSGSSNAAYFGEINSRLAQRAGAVGAVINGATRDSHSTAIPVASACVTPFDCRDCLHVKAIQRPMMVDGDWVYPNDIIMSDSDGVVVIPNKEAERLFQEAQYRYSTEDAIMLGVATGTALSELKRIGGEF